MFLPFCLNGQIKFAEYNSFDGNKYEISLDPKESFTLYINASPSDKFHDEGGFMVKKDRYNQFITALKDARSKYIEWTAVAKTNNVRTFSKIMQVDCNVGGYFKYGNKWQFQFSIRPVFNYIILETEGKIDYALSIHTGELKSSSNKYMDVDGYILAFLSAEEIDEFIKLLDIEKISREINKGDVESLFKN